MLVGRFAFAAKSSAILRGSMIESVELLLDSDTRQRDLTRKQVGRLHEQIWKGRFGRFTTIC